MKFLTVTFYKLKMMLGDRLFFAAMVVIPVLITLAAGYALRYEKADKISIAIVDEDNSDYSAELYNRLLKKESFDVKSADREKALDMLKDKKIEEAFVIKKGFKEKIIKGENESVIDVVKSPSSFSASFAGEVVAGEVMRFVTGSMAANWVMNQYDRLKLSRDDRLFDEVVGDVEAQWDPEPLMTIDYKELEGETIREVEKNYMPAAAAASIGVIVVFIMFYVLFSSSWLIEERNNGTLKRLISGPDALINSFFGSITALMILGMIQAALFYVIVKLASGVDIFHGVLSFVVFAAYLLSVISIGMFLSSILKTPSQLQTGAPVFTLLTGFAGGCFWNFTESSGRLKQLSLMTPQGWALEGINRLAAGTGNTGNLMVPLAVLLTTALILLPLSYIIIKRQFN